MDPEKKARLEAAGWTVADAQAFLGLSEEDMEVIKQRQRQSREKVYDAQIEPLMAKILFLCKEHKIPVFAEFQLSGDDFCRSVHAEEAHSIFKHYCVLSQCIEETGVNIDKYIMWLMKEYRGKHTSMILHRIENDHIVIPPSPEEPQITPLRRD